jgi:hypothetical protein
VKQHIAAAWGSFIPFFYLLAAIVIVRTRTGSSSVSSLFPAAAEIFIEQF